MTRTKAIKDARKSLLGWGRNGETAAAYVYQFPRGHWGWASLASEIARDLEACGMIYASHGIKALQFERVAV